MSSEEDDNYDDDDDDFDESEEGEEEEGDFEDDGEISHHGVSSHGGPPSQNPVLSSTGGPKTPKMRSKAREADKIYLPPLPEVGNFRTWVLGAETSIATASGMDNDHVILSFARRASTRKRNSAAWHTLKNATSLWTEN